VEVLSEIVFGLALSVGALALVGSPPTTSGSLFLALATFGFSFLILILVWLAFTHLRSMLNFESRWSVSMNVVLLFTVSIEPFLFDLIVRSNETAAFLATANQLFAIDIGVMVGVLGLFASYLATTPRTVLGADDRRQLRQDALNRWVVAGIFFLSTAPIFGQVHLYGQPVRVAIWIVGLVILLASRLRQPMAHWI
jgi:uncharacterized membrane protein